jgi:hypothetical protein
VRNYTYYCVSWNFSSSKKKKSTKYVLVEKIYSRTSTIPSKPSNPSNKGRPSYITCARSTSSHIKSGWSLYGSIWPRLEARFSEPSDLISDFFPYIFSTYFCDINLHVYFWRSLLICKRSWPPPLLRYICLRHKAITMRHRGAKWEEMLYKTDL